MYTGFTVRQPAFEGSLAELGTALRNGSLLPSDLDLLQLVREWLKYFNALARVSLDDASEALPRVAQVIELKLRLLLPKPPREDHDEDDFEEVLATVAMLEEIEGAIDFLRTRREDRRLLMSARTPRPELDRRTRPLGVAAGRLAELATRLRAQSYFEVVRDSFGFKEAARRLIDGIRGRGRVLFAALAPGEDWRTRTIMFAAMLELLREERISALQAEAFGPIGLTLRKEPSGE